MAESPPATPDISDRPPGRSSSFWRSRPRWIPSISFCRRSRSASCSHHFSVPACASGACLRELGLQQTQALRAEDATGGEVEGRPALSAASDVGKSFLLAMAQDDGPSKMADIQQRLGVDVNYASQYRLRLIAAELVHPTRRGYVDSALPYLREYLRQHSATDA